MHCDELLTIVVLALVNRFVHGRVPSPIRSFDASAVRLICHSLAFADPDVCGGGGGDGKGWGDRESEPPWKITSYFNLYRIPAIGPAPPPLSVNSWTPGILGKAGTLVGH